MEVNEYKKSKTNIAYFKKVVLFYKQELISVVNQIEPVAVDVLRYTLKGQLERVKQYKQSDGVNEDGFATHTLKIRKRDNFEPTEYKIAIDGYYYNVINYKETTFYIDIDLNITGKTTKKASEL